MIRWNETGSERAVWLFHDFKILSNSSVVSSEEQKEFKNDSNKKTKQRQEKESR